MDLIVPLLARVLEVGIVVVELDNTNLNYITNDHLMYPSSNLKLEEALFLLKSGLHYDPLLVTRFSSGVKVQDVLEEVDKETMSPLQSSNCEPHGVISIPEIPISDLGVSSHCETTPIDKETVLDSERILASLCVNAPDFEIRDCLRKYSCDYTLKRLKSVFNSSNKPILEKTASYLKINTSNLKKPGIIHLLICKIQNLLPDTCQICNESYVCEINDSPFLSVNCVDKKSTISVSCANLG